MSDQEEVSIKERGMKRVISWPLRILLAGIFFYAGWVKVSDPTLFAIKVRNYELLSDPWVALVAMTLPWLEIICAVCVLVRRLESGALIWIAGMLLGFMFGMVSALLRGLDIDCGCFGGTLDRGSLAVALVMDAVLLVVAVRLWLLATNSVLSSSSVNGKP